MSEYTYTNSDGDTLCISGLADKDAVYIEVTDIENTPRSVRVDHAEAPTVALEVLKVGGHAALAELLEGAVKAEAEAIEKAEAEAAEKKLQERRDALAKVYYWLSYERLGQGSRQAVDHIITLQDMLAAAK